MQRARVFHVYQTINSDLEVMKTWEVNEQGNIVNIKSDKGLTFCKKSCLVLSHSVGLLRYSIMSFGKRLSSKETCEKHPTAIRIRYRRYVSIQLVKHVTNNDVIQTFCMRENKSTCQSTQSLQHCIKREAAHSLVLHHGAHRVSALAWLEESATRLSERRNTYGEPKWT